MELQAAAEEMKRERAEARNREVSLASAVSLFGILVVTILP